MIALIIKLVALPFTGITGTVRAFFIKVMIRKVEDLIIEVIKVRWYVCFYTYIAMIKNNRQTNDLV